MSKVLLVNGSPHKNGCVNTALTYVAKILTEEGVDSEIYWIGNKPIGGCIGCFNCMKKGQCIFKDKVNEFTQKALEFDGFIFGSPVYYAGMNGNLKSFMDRVFFSASKQDPHPFRFKPAAAIATARRTGSVVTFDQITKYFLHQQMPVVSSRYWNEIYGQTPEDIMKDEEGLQILRVLARNMAWMLKLKEAGEKAGITPPKQEETRVSFNFIR